MLLEGKGHEPAPPYPGERCPEGYIAGFIRAFEGGSVLQQLSTKWDSAFYVGIAQNGYPTGGVNGSYAFAPLYPGFIRLANSLLGNWLLSGAFVANVFSVLTVVAFYHVAEIYFQPREALCASLAFCAFPTFVTYGLVAYSEPVYLFFAILAVFFFLKSRYLFAGIAASLSVLASYQSLLVPVLLMGILALNNVIIKRRGQRDDPGRTPKSWTAAGRVSRLGFLWLALPIAIFVLWMYALDVRSGQPFSIFTAQEPWGTGVANPIAQFQYFFNGGVFSTQGDPVSQLLLRYPYTLTFLALGFPLWKIDKGLALYSSAFMLFVLSLVGTAYMSGPRLMLSAWPVLLVFGGMKKELIIPVLVLFTVLSLQSTYFQSTMFWT